MNDNILIVISCDSPSFWYRDDIGKTFTINSISSNACNVNIPNQSCGITYFIQLTDCIIGKEAIRKYKLDNLLSEL